MLLAETGGHGYAVLATLVVFIAASVWLGMLAQRWLDSDRFLEGYFLGNRGLGAWAMALTATVQSGGTFMGFPSLVYSHGWVVALWIAPYMVVPLASFAVVGKRLAQLSRRTGAITVPELLRARFDDARVGLTASILLMGFMTIMTIAQFKAGAIVMKLAWPDSGVLAFAEDPQSPLDLRFYIGLAVFSLTVVGYTWIGGFLASVWTDLFQSVLMLFGVVALLYLALSSVESLEGATRIAMERRSVDFAQGPGHAVKPGWQFLPPGLSISMWFIWIWGGFAAPACMVRVMAASSTDVLRKSIALLSTYNLLIYPPLIVICVCAHSILPPLEKSDEVVPRLALELTKSIPGGSVLSGLILAAPFGAVMATVSCYLLVIASGLVEDVYRRVLRPQATIAELKRVTSIAIVGVGVFSVLMNLRPVQYLQALVVFSTSCGAGTFCIPVLMACYWRRATAAGCLAAMLSGAGTIAALFGLGWVQEWAASNESTWPLARSIIERIGRDTHVGVADPAAPYYFCGAEPIVWSLIVSGLAGVAVSLMTAPPDASRVAKCFDE